MISYDKNYCCVQVHMFAVLGESVCMYVSILYTKVYTRFYIYIRSTYKLHTRENLRAAHHIYYFFAHTRGANFLLFSLFSLNACSLLQYDTIPYHSKPYDTMTCRIWCWCNFCCLPFFFFHGLVCCCFFFLPSYRKYTHTMYIDILRTSEYHVLYQYIIQHLDPIILCVLTLALLCGYDDRRSAVLVSSLPFPLLPVVEYVCCCCRCYDRVSPMV